MNELSVSYTQNTNKMIDLNALARYVTCVNLKLSNLNIFSHVRKNRSHENSDRN